MFLFYFLFLNSIAGGMIFEPKAYLSNISKSGIDEFKTIDQLFYLLLKKKKKKNQPFQSRNSIYQDTYSLLWVSKNLGPCVGLKSHILSTIRPRRINHGGTS